MKDQRATGTLLHISSLPGRFGIGDMGEAAYRFVDFLVESGQKYWQILPTGDPGPAYTPYQSISAFAGNPLFIDIDALKGMELLSDHEIGDVPEFSQDCVEYERVEALKMPLLKKAFENFKIQDESKKWECHHFGDNQSYWIDEYALFKSLKTHFGTPWFQWEPEIRYANHDTVEYWKGQVGDEIYFHKFVQYLYFKQIKNLKQYANDRGVKLVGDIPIFIAYDSADVWGKSYFFHLDDQRNPYVVAGVPPDYFSETGQRWGNPLYKWDTMRHDDYLWWRLRFEALFEQCDLVRLDHFRGFEAYWEIPAHSETAMNGRWVKGPGYDLFDTLKRYLADLPVIAEDLGIITNEVEHLRDQYHFPGMKILQFAFGDSPANGFLPHNHVVNSIVYTGTHDNDTIVGWYNNLKKTKDPVLEEISEYIDLRDGVPWGMIRAAFASVSKLAVIPMQDYLGLDNSARMNIPGTIEGNWTWRMKAIPHHLQGRIRSLVEKYNRLGA